MGRTKRRYERRAGPLDILGPWIRSQDATGDPPLPPRRMRFMGETDEAFVSVGDHLAETLVRYGGLRPGANVLDVGCGYGRLPHALLRRGFDGSYLGLDVLGSHVRWCERNLRNPSVGFQLVDIHNGRYNPVGSAGPEEIDLGEATFESIAVFSVFTHMWPEDLSAYLSLLANHLSSEGRIVATFFLFDEEWQRMVDSNGARVRLPLEHTSFCRYEFEDDPLHYVGYDLDWVRAEAEAKGLVVCGEPVYGTWSGRAVDDAQQPGYQDIVSFALA